MFSLSLLKYFPQIYSFLRELPKKLYFCFVGKHKKVTSKIEVTLQITLKISKH